MSLKIPGATMPPPSNPPELSPLRLLVVDDDEIQRKLLKANLARVDLEIELANSAEEALSSIFRRAPDAVLSDVSMPGKSGIDLVREVRVFDKTLPIMLMTIGSTVDLAIEGIRAGATEFLQKPVNVQALWALMERALRERPLREALEQRPPSASELFTGTHPRLDEMRRFAEHVARLPNARVLITGESGTGKSLLARAIHDLSGTPGRFMEVNCAALPANLLETELFGYEKGAFTDARTTKRGLIELADRGTLFLDEIATLPLELQAKLLTFLDGRPFRRVGGTEDLKVSTRIVAATNEDLQMRIREQTFREDLFFRLNIASVKVPALRDMPEIIPELAERFVGDISESFTRPPPALDPTCFRLLSSYEWRGNVRELRNTIERALIFHGSGPLHLRPPGDQAGPVDPVARGDQGAPDAGNSAGVILPPGLTLEEVERRYLAATLSDMEGTSLVQIAEQLDISRKTLWEKRRRYDL